MKIRKIVSMVMGGALAMSLVFGGLSAVSGRRLADAAAAEPEFDENDVVLTFTNMSDSHIGYGNDSALLRNALVVSKSFAQNGIDALLFNGDQTQTGVESEAKEFVSILEEQFDLTQTPAIITHGNHDTYWSGCMNTTQFAAAYGEKVYTFDEADTDYTTGNRHVIVNGYHFLSVQINSYTGRNFTNPVSPATETWLRGMLDQLTSENPNQYIFVSCHCPAPNTVFGSYAEQDTGPWGASKEVNTILEGYSQVILFSGHTHYAINDERAINQSTYTQVQSGSTSDADMEKGYLETGNVALSGGTPNRRSQSQGELVEVDGQGRIRITRIDFARAKQIKDYWYLDACSSDGSHLNRYTAEARAQANTAPLFSETAKITATELSASSVRIDWTVAEDDDMVHSYSVAAYDQARQELASVKTLSQWYNYPNLTELPSTKNVTLSFTISYPYTVEVIAYDSFGLESEAFTLTVYDTTEEDKASAAALDSRISALANVTLTEDDGAEVLAIRKGINALSYKGKAFLTQYDTFVSIEASYYNTFTLTADATEYVPSVKDVYSIAATAAKGWAEQSDYTGVSLNWSATTKNNSLGFTRTYDLNGLHVSFANLKISSDNQKLGIIVSNTVKDKWSAGTALVIYIDFAQGNLYVNNDVFIGQSDCLLYENLGATPFDFVFALEEGALTLTVHTIFAEESFYIEASNLQDLSHLTDFSACYVSFSPWDTRTTASVDVVAIHGGESDCLEYPTESDDPIGGEDKPNDPIGDGENEPDDPQDGNEGDNNEGTNGEENGGDTAKGGCGTISFGGWGGGIALGVLAVAAVVAVFVRKKRAE